MPVPYLGNAMKGWTTKTSFKQVVQSIVDHEVVETETYKTYPANLQPMPAAKVNRKPEEQRTWSWWSIIITDKVLLFATDDILIDPSGRRFKIQSANDWRTSGFTKYEAIEDFKVST